MKLVFLEYFETSISFSIIIAFLYIVLYLKGKKITAKCRYSLWVIVMVSLAIPFGVISNTALFTVPIQISEANTVESTGLISSVNMDTVANEIPVNEKVEQSQDLQVLDNQDSSILSRDTSSSVNFFKINLSIILYSVSFVWLAGVVIYFLWNAVVYLRYTKKLKRNLVPADGFVREIFSLICSQNKNHREPKLFISNRIDTPILFGLFSSTIVIPDNLGSETAVSSILAHELTHYKRRDLWLKLIMLIVESLHWFNPLVHLAVGQCNKEMELSCDERVLRNYSDEARVTYGTMMLDIVKSCHSKNTFLTTQFNPKPNAVKERFMNILDGTQKRSGKFIILLLLLFCIPANLLIACNDVSRTVNQTESKLETEVNNNLVTTSSEGITSPNVASVYNEVGTVPLIMDGTVKTLSYQNTYPKDGKFPDNELADTVESLLKFYSDFIFNCPLQSDYKSQYEIVQSDKGEIRYYHPKYGGGIPNNDAFISLLTDKFTDSFFEKIVLKNSKFKIMQDGTIGVVDTGRGSNMTYVYKEYEIVTKTQDSIVANIVAWYFGENVEDSGIQLDNYKLKNDAQIHSKSIPLILKKEDGKWKIDEITLWN